MIKKLMLLAILILIVGLVGFVATCDKNTAYNYNGVTLYHPGFFQVGPITCYVGSK